MNHRTDRSVSERHDWFPPPAIGSWRMSARDDPVTGLVAWPGFFARLPGVVAEHLCAGSPVGLAIGDVDDFAGYVASMSTADVRSFGHLAGIELRACLGETARDWLHDDGVGDGCLATFGGDDLVFAAATESEAAFQGQVARLRAVLTDALPLSVSFAAAVLDGHTSRPPHTAADSEWRALCAGVLGRVERALLAQKRARRYHRPSLPVVTVSVR